MGESDEQRANRRAISQWLTRQVNDVSANSINKSIRKLVLQALENINSRFKEFKQETLQKKYHIKAKQPLLNFYIKGGNAFKVAMGEGGVGDSDWDTQVVLDPWSPAPIQDALYGGVEDIIFDEFRKTGLEIAKVNAAGTSASGAITLMPKASGAVTLTSNASGSIILNAGGSFEKYIQCVWLQDNKEQKVVKGKDFSNYRLTLDNPQTVHKIFDHDKVGLWLSEQSPLNEKHAKKISELIPSMIFNDNIKPFVLYRQGYTWHLELESGKQAVGINSPVSIKKPILMELIDVTIPRQNMVEGVEVWEAIYPNQGNQVKMVVKEEGVTVGDLTVQLPFPDIEYHLREQLTMLCEVADGSSRHQDKMGRRFKRLDDIYTKFTGKQNEFEKIIAEHVGVSNINDGLPASGAITIETALYSILDINIKDDEKGLFNFISPDKVNPTQKAYRLGVQMMNIVTKDVEKCKNNFVNGQLRDEVKEKIMKGRNDKLNHFLLQWGVNLVWSDDLVLVDFLVENDYLKVNEVGLCGIDYAVMGRVKNYSALMNEINKIVNLVKESVVHGWSMKYRTYNTIRDNGLSYECTFVLFKDKKAHTLLTLTTANEQEVSLSHSAENIPPAPFAEIARQRKMAASLIEDYIVRTALSKQYEACKEIIKVI
ncbi:MAG: hypothetical protein HQK84_05515 [Nitrospinae bacterium]|nr:hypothetical protein [Nitrospinota bacterium]